MSIPSIPAHNNSSKPFFNLNGAFCTQFFVPRGCCKRFATAPVIILSKSTILGVLLCARVSFVQRYAFANIRGELWGRNQQKHLFLKEGMVCFGKNGKKFTNGFLPLLFIKSEGGFMVFEVFSIKISRWRGCKMVFLCSLSMNLCENAINH